MSHHTCEAHAKNHVHVPDCGHERIRHDDHYDYLVGDHLHHMTIDGCADHGARPENERDDGRAL